MAKYCKTKPDKGLQLFNDLKERFSYRTAWKIWAVSTLPAFLEGKNFKLDSEGFPNIQELLEDKQIQELLGEDTIIKGLEKKFPVLKDTIENYTRLVQEAQLYNSNPNNIKYIAIIDRDSDSDSLKVSVQRRTRQAEQIANEQYSTQVLNEKLADILSSVGITIGDLTEAEMAAGRVGITDFSKVKNLAEDCISVIRVANNQEGYKAIGEEFSHLVIGAYKNEAIIQRALNALNNTDVLKEVLGEEYDLVYDFQDGDMELIAEEALGKLLRENLAAEISKSPKSVNFLINKVLANIKGKFRKIDAEKIQKAITEANGLMGQLAKEILNNQLQIKQDKLRAVDRKAQFNALSDRIKANIDILKKIKNIEVKRYRISPKISPEEKLAQKEKISSLEEFEEQEKDTRIGLYNYGIKAIEDLKSVEESLTRRTYTGLPSFATLRRARSYIQSYSGFIKDMQKAIIDTEEDEEVPDFLTDIELEDGTVVSMSEMINELNALSDQLTERYFIYTKKAVTEFFRPFFGNDITLTAGSHKGEKINIESVIQEAVKDISFTDLYLDSMGNSSDLFLQMFDAVAKKANDNARQQTIQDADEITRLRLFAEENGITDYEWMFEKDSKGRKTGNYISEYNIGAFREAKQNFIESLDKRYGKNPKGEDAKGKLKEYKDWIKKYADAEDPSMPKPIEKWLNKEYADMQANPIKKALYEEYMTLKWRADNKYPDNRVSAFKAIQRRKSSGNRLLDSLANPTHLWSNLKEATKQAFLEAEDDDQLYGNAKSSLTNFDGTEYMALPVLYTTNLKNPEELSTDIFADLLVYSYSTNLYNEMDKIVDPLETAKDYMTSGERRVQQTRGDNSVKERINVLGHKVVNTIYKGDTNSERKLNEWMESHIYQRYMKDAGVIDTGLLKLSKGKIGNMLLSLNSMAQLGFNFLANSANIATGIAMANIEAAAGQYFNASALLKADKTFFSYLPAYMSELGSRNKTNFLSLFDKLFNIKGDFSSDIKRNQKKNILQKIFGSNFAFIGQTGGDFWLYNRVALAYCQAMQVLVPTKTKVVKKVKGLNDALDTIDSIIENSHNMSLTEAEQSYINKATGTSYARVTSVISMQNESNDISEAWKTPSTNIGTGIDNLVRDFFADLLVKTDDGVWHHDSKGDDLEAIYPNVKTEDLNAFLEQLSSLKIEFDKKGLSVVPRDIVARGKIRINDNGIIRELNVAGTLDLLVYDRQGNFYIYDMKTHRGKIRNTTKHHWAMQLSLYKRFLEEEYGITVKGLNIIPIQVHYDTPAGAVSAGEEGTAEYSVIEGTNQLLQDGKFFKDTKPSLDKIIPLTEIKKIPIEYNALGYNKQFAKVSDVSDYTQMSLLEALQIINTFSDRSDIKKMVVPDGTLDSDGLSLDLDKVSRKIQRMGHKLFGIYNDEDSVVAQRMVLGRALLQYRQWIKPQFNHRFQKAQVNLLTGKTEEGYYRTAGKFLAKKFLCNFMNEALRGKIQIAANWDELSDDEKSNIKRAVFEIIQCLCVYLIATYAPWPDDKKRPWVLKYAEYIAQREKHELGMLTPSIMQAQELAKTIQSPLPIMSSINNMINLIRSVFSPGDWIDEKTSGPYKGMSTLEANFLKAPLPVVTWYKQIDKLGDQIDTSINYYARSNVQ